MLELLKALDAFAWGLPLDLIGRNGYLFDHPTGPLQVTRLPKAFQLIFTKDKGTAMCRALLLSVRL